MTERTASRAPRVIGTCLTSRVGRPSGNRAESALVALGASNAAGSRATALLRNAHPDLQRFDRQLSGAVRRWRMANTKERAQRATRDVGRARAARVRRVLQVVDDLCGACGLDDARRRQLVDACYADHLRAPLLRMRLRDRLLLVAENFAPDDAAIAALLGCSRRAVANRRYRLGDSHPAWAEQLEAERAARANAAKPGPIDVRDYYRRALVEVLSRRPGRSTRKRRVRAELLTIQSWPRRGPGESTPWSPGDCLTIFQQLEP